MYRTFAPLMVPIIKLYLLKRAKLQPAYREHWDERFGHYKYPPVTRPRLWIHAVSLGETNAARPLINAALRRFGDIEILLTHMTPTGRAAGARIMAAYPGRVTQCYLPYDTIALMKRFLVKTNPVMGIVMETEVWPNLLYLAQKMGIPMVLANARESQKSYLKAKNVERVMSPAFASFAAVLAQGKDDARRLTDLGAQHVQVCGSIKFDMHPDAAKSALGAEQKKKLARPVLLIASTRKDEEALFVPQLSRLPAKTLTVIVPRHPERFDAVASLLAERGIAFARRSRTSDLGQLAPSVQVLLGDTMGEMDFYCSLADVCIMGGSFGDFGGQNLIEPMAHGVPVIMGPSTFNFAQIATDAAAAGAMVPVANAAQAVQSAAGLLSDSRTRLDRAGKARSFAKACGGATARMMEVIAKLWQQRIKTWSMS